MSVSTTTNKTNNSKSHSPLSNESILLLFGVVEGYDSVELPMLACDIFVLLNIVFNNWS